MADSRSEYNSKKQDHKTTRPRDNATQGTTRQQDRSLVVSSPVVCGLVVGAAGALTKSMPGNEHATHVPPQAQSRAAANDRGYNAPISVF